jgi:hypothetical protein
MWTTGAALAREARSHVVTLWTMCSVMDLSWFLNSWLGALLILPIVSVVFVAVVTSTAALYGQGALATARQIVRLQEQVARSFVSFGR